MRTEPEVLEQVVASLQDISFRTDITAETQIQDIGLDSIDFLDFFFRLQQIYEVQISQEQLENILKKDPDSSTAEMFKHISGLSIRDLTSVIYKAAASGLLQESQTKPQSANSLEIETSEQAMFREVQMEKLKTPDSQQALELWSQYWQDKSVSEVSQELRERMRVRF